MATPAHDPATLVHTFETRLRLARATELAHSNRLLEAEAILSPGRSLPSSPEHLDLLARIHIRQGRLDLARQRWQTAIKNGGPHAEFEECLAALESYSRQLFQRRVWKWRITLTLCVIALFIFLQLLIRWATGHLT